MKRVVIAMTAALALLSATPLLASTIVHDSFTSKTLGRDIKMNIYLPENYDKNGDSLPVIYMLHGAGGDEMSWLKDGGLKTTADVLMERDELRSSVIVMPTLGPSHWYTDANAVNAESAFVEDLLPYVAQHYNVRTDRAGRSIAGLSMGGYGALNLSLSHPSLFCAAGVLSPAIYNPFPPTTSASRTTPQFSENGKFDKEAWSQSLYPARLPSYQKSGITVPMWIESGDHDRFGIALATAQLFSTIHEMQPNDVEYRVIDGDHDWMVFRESSVSALRYMDKKCDALDK